MGLCTISCHTILTRSLFVVAQNVVHIACSELHVLTVTVVRFIKIKIKIKIKRLELRVI